MFTLDDEPLNQLDTLSFEFQVQVLAARIQAAVMGRVQLTIEEAGHITGASRAGIAEDIELGRLVCNRRKENGKRRIDIVELARFIMECRKHSKPVPVEDDD